MIYVALPLAPPPNVAASSLPFSEGPTQFEPEGSQKVCPTSLGESPRHQGPRVSGSSNDIMAGCDGDTWGGSEGCGGCGVAGSGSRCVRRLRRSVAARENIHGVAVCQSPVREKRPAQMLHCLLAPYAQFRAVIPIAPRFTRATTR